MKFGLLAVFSILSTLSFGNPNIESRVFFRSELKNVISTYTLREIGEGKYEFITNPNKCVETPDGEIICTELAVFTQEVQLELIEDLTPADGPVIYKILDGLTLRQASRVRTFSICSEQDEKTECLPVTVSVFLVQTAEK